MKKRYQKVRFCSDLNATGFGERNKGVWRVRYYGKDNPRLQMDSSCVCTRRNRESFGHTQWKGLDRYSLDVHHSSFLSRYWKFISRWMWHPSIHTLDFSSLLFCFHRSTNSLSPFDNPKRVWETWRITDAFRARIVEYNRLGFTDYD